jgi:hypothetical protein
MGGHSHHIAETSGTRKSLVSSCSGVVVGRSRKPVFLVRFGLIDQRPSLSDSSLIQGDERRQGRQAGRSSAMLPLPLLSNQFFDPAPELGLPLCADERQRQLGQLRHAGANRRILPTAPRSRRNPSVFGGGLGQETC